MNDKKSEIFDQSVELIIEGLALIWREFKEVLLLLQKGRNLYGTHRYL